MTCPVPAVSGDPRVDLDKSVRAQRVDPALCIRAHLHQADLAQDTEMPGNRGLGQLGQGGHQITGGTFAVGQRVEQCPSVGFGDGLEDVH